METPNRPITTVGTKELVDFVSQEISQVPAKIDTGADSSAVWASNIHEENGTLRYTLFDKMSPYYTGQELTTQSFSMTSIKNSFGKTEFRYKVSLRIRIAGRVIHVRFTLANRENNSQPILIGRRTLHGKFIVDVSRDNVVKRVPRVLVISVKTGPIIGSFLKEIQKIDKNISINHISYDDLIFTFKERSTKICILKSGEDIASYDIIHFKTYRQLDLMAAISRYAHKRGVKVIDRISQYYSDASKLYQYVILNDNMIPIPHSIVVAPNQLEKYFNDFKHKLGLPFILKGIHEARGRNNFLISSEEQFLIIARKLKEENIYSVAQEYIYNESDLRVLVFGRRIGLVMVRQRPNKNTHLTRSKGGKAILADETLLPSNARVDCINAARVMDRGVVGVDLIQNLETQEWVCLEVNDNPQIATGAFVKEKQKAFAEYLRTELNK